MSYVVEVENLVKYFPAGGTFLSFGKRRKVHAVDGISFSIKKGENFGLAGESGCGKSTTARLVLRLLEPTAGTVRFMGKDIFGLNKNEMKEIRREMQMIFQDPYAALNPRKTVYQVISKPFKIHDVVRKEEIENQVLKLLEIVGLSPPESFVDTYPHELSGGQRQRVTIARAIALRPKFVVADEPVSALDMSIRAQILNIMRKLQNDYDLTYLFITHDLAVMRSICDRIAIMYLGKIVELDNTENLFRIVELDNTEDVPKHPYTRSLISATPIPKPRVARSKETIILKGDVPSPIDPPSGCRFQTRCPLREPICVHEEPKLIDIRNGHYLACHVIS